MATPIEQMKTLNGIYIKYNQKRAEGSLLMASTTQGASESGTIDSTILDLGSWREVTPKVPRPLQPTPAMLQSRGA